MKRLLAHSRPPGPQTWDPLAEATWPGRPLRGAPHWHDLRRCAVRLVPERFTEHWSSVSMGYASSPAPLVALWDGSKTWWEPGEAQDEFAPPSRQAVTGLHWDEATWELQQGATYGLSDLNHEPLRQLRRAWDLWSISTQRQASSLLIPLCAAVSVVQALDTALNWPLRTPEEDPGGEDQAQAWLRGELHWIVALRRGERLRKAPQLLDLPRPWRERIDEEAAARLSEQLAQDHGRWTWGKDPPVTWKRRGDILHWRCRRLAGRARRQDILGLITHRQLSELSGHEPSPYAPQLTEASDAERRALEALAAQALVDCGVDEQTEYQPRHWNAPPHRAERGA